MKKRILDFVLDLFNTHNQAQILWTVEMQNRHRYPPHSNTPSFPLSPFLPFRSFFDLTLTLTLTEHTTPQRQKQKQKQKQRSSALFSKSAKTDSSILQLSATRQHNTTQHNTTLLSPTERERDRFIHAIPLSALHRWSTALLQRRKSN